MDQGDVSRFVGELYLQSKAEIEKLHSIVQDQQIEIESLKMLLQENEQKLTPII